MIENIWDGSDVADSTTNEVQAESVGVEWFQEIVNEIASEIRVDENGRGFASVSAVARICGVSQQSVSEGYRLKGGKLAKLLTKHRFDPTGWNSNGVPDVAMALIVLYYAHKAGRNCTAKAELVNEVISSVGARVWMQRVKGWVEPSEPKQPQITEDHVRAVGFAEEKFEPFKNKHPIAADIFLHFQGVKVSASTSEFALPSAELQQAMNGAFLNLNRSGLAMNKLFHFIDRIPTMQRMDQESISEMAEALIDSGREIARLQKENAELRRKAESRTQTPGRSPSPRTSAKTTAKRAKPTPAKPAEVVSPKSRLKTMRSAEVVEHIALPPAKTSP